jgi:hypothetical protein
MPATEMTAGKKKKVSRPITTPEDNVLTVKLQLRISAGAKRSAISRMISAGTEPTGLAPEIPLYR